MSSGGISDEEAEFYVLSERRSTFVLGLGFIFLLGAFFSLSSQVLNGES